jgi:hypothetical protein
LFLSSNWYNNKINFRIKLQKQARRRSLIYSFATPPAQIGS